MNTPGRVASVQAPVEFLGNSENYLVLREYATHCETWVLRKGVGQGHSEELTFEDRNGEKWLVWHDYHHTSAQAHAGLEFYADLLLEVEAGYWKVTL